MNTFKRLRNAALLGTAVGVIFAIGAAAGMLRSWSAAVSDRLFLSRPASPSIAIVAIDDASITELGGWPFRRDVHAALIRSLGAAGVAAIGYDVNFPERKAEMGDEELAAALREAGNVVLPIELQVTAQGGGFVFDPKRTVAPDALFALAAAGVGHVNPPPDLDNVVRRVPLAVAADDGTEVPAFAVRTLERAGKMLSPAEVPVDGLQRLVVHYPDRPFKGFRTVSAKDVVRGTADLSGLRGAVIFVGATASNLHDALLVPTSRGVPMPGVEIHASIADTVLGRQWLRPVPLAVQMLALVLLGLFVGLVTAAMRSRFAIPVLFASWAAVVAGSFAAFDAGWIADLILPTAVFIFGYSAVTVQLRRSSDKARRELKAAFARYVSPDVVDQIIRDPGRLKLGGVRRRMSVMFSDIRGFTTISEGMGPDDLVHVLNIYLDRMTDLVFANRGTLDKYIGDAVMAFWNAPLDQPDHAVRAVRTTLQMRDALAEMNASKAFGPGMELHIGLGVNTGEMVVGNVGGQARFDYTVIGDNVNLASRLEGLTKEYGIQVLVSEATMKELGDAVLTRRLDKVAVKGKKEPVLVGEAMDPMELATAERKVLAKDFEAALDLYFAKKFSEAIAKAGEILAKHPDDGPSKLLKSRAEAFLGSPPAEDWDGTWVYTKK